MQAHRDDPTTDGTVGTVTFWTVLYTRLGVCGRVLGKKQPSSLCQAEITEKHEYDTQPTQPRKASSLHHLGSSNVRHG